MKCADLNQGIALAVPQLAGAGDTQINAAKASLIKKPDLLAAFGLF